MPLHSAKQRRTRHSGDCPGYASPSRLPRTTHVLLLASSGHPDRVTYVIRTHGPPTQAIPIVRALISNMPLVDAEKVYLLGFHTVDQLISEAAADQRFRGRIVSLFAIISLLLSAIGIYGVQSHAINGRTREIGIRMALGARPGAVCRLIMRDAVGWTLLGICVGVGAGISSTRLISGFLFGTGQLDLLTFIISPCALLMATLVAVCGPVRRGMRIDPAASLRCE